MSDTKFGPKMLKLSAEHRACVLAYMHSNNKAEAARIAGYKDVRKQSWRIFQRQDVCEAIQEETLRCIESELPANVTVIKTLANNPQTSDAVRLKAAVWLATIGGLRQVTEQRVEVNVNIQQQVQEIQKAMGWSNEQVMAAIGNVSEAEYVELPAPATPEEDEF